MNSLSRSTALKIGASLMVLLSLLDIIVYQIPALLVGAEATNQLADANGGPPFVVVLITFTVDVVALIAAYGAWNSQRWGVVLLLIAAVISGMSGMGGLLFAPDLSTRIVSAIGVIASAIIIVCCLWRERRVVTNKATT